MTPEELLADPPALHLDDHGVPQQWSLASETLRYLGDLLKPGSSTMETGAGLTSVFFAVCGARHTAIAPDPSLFERIAEYCSPRGIGLEQVTFIPQRSEVYLPKADLPALDLFLVDGNHAFPTPFIDYYYGASRVKVGGYMVVDDTQLLSGRILADFLKTDRHWKVADLFEKTAVFEKLDQGVHDDGHGEQVLERRWRDLLTGEDAGILDTHQWLSMLEPWKK